MCENKLRDMTAMRDGFKAACDLRIDEVQRLRVALESIRQYGSDTLSGRADGPDDRSWQRAAVLEMTRRASSALSSAGQTT